MYIQVHKTHALKLIELLIHQARRTGIHHLRIGTLIVSKDGKLSGLIMNRDHNGYATAPGRDPDKTKAQEVMNIDGPRAVKKMLSTGPSG